MRKLTIIAALCATNTMIAQAELRINGFANLVGGITASDDQFYGYDDRISFSDESIFALQVSGDINDKMTATGQIVSRGNNDYKAEFEWAYITYKANDELSISAGRLRLPLFKYSSSLDVGYSYHWVNAPRAVYGVAFNNIEGINAAYSNYAGDWEYNLQAAFGVINTEQNGISIVAENALIMSAEVAYEWFKARLVYGTSKATVDSNDVKNATALLVNDAAFTGFVSTLPFPEELRQAALFQFSDPNNKANLAQLSNNLLYENDLAPFYGVGLEVDKFDWFVSGEYTLLETDTSFVSTAHAYYVTAGMRIGKLTPSVTYEKYKQDEIKFEDQVAALPAPLGNIVGSLSTQLQSPQFAKYSIITAGLRYDYDTNVALKVDISKRNDELNEAADATLLRFAVNYVF